MAGGIVYIKQYIEGVPRSIAYWSDDGTASGNLSPEPITGVAAGSGLTPVSGAFAATGVSPTFAPGAGRDFNVYLAPTANAVQLERQRDGTNWEVVLTAALISALPPSFSMSEPQLGVPYRLNCTAWSASQSYGFSA